MEINKKGFTLVELLAVIIILGILAVITTPLVRQYIDEVEIKSLKRTAESYASAAQQFIVDTTGTDKEYRLKSNILLYLDMDGTKPTSGVILMTDDTEYMMKLVLGDYCFIKESDATNFEITNTKDLSMCEYYTPESCFNTVTDSVNNGVSIYSYKCGYTMDTSGTDVAIDGTYDYVSIPKQIGGKNVTSIGGAAFSFLDYEDSANTYATYTPSYNYSAKHGVYGVTFPDTVVSIGTYAFAGNRDIRYSNYENITKIGDGAFFNTNSNVEPFDSSFGK